jgi:hypothetical protein
MVWLSPAVAHHVGRWGRTDALVAEPGAYLLNWILASVAMLVFLALFYSAHKQTRDSRYKSRNGARRDEPQHQSVCNQIAEQVSTGKPDTDKPHERPVRPDERPHNPFGLTDEIVKMVIDLGDLTPTCEPHARTRALWCDTGPSNALPGPSQIQQSEKAKPLNSVSPARDNSATHRWPRSNPFKEKVFELRCPNCGFARPYDIPLFVPYSCRKCGVFLKAVAIEK